MRSERGKTGSFSYRERSVDDVKSRASQSGSSRDSFLKDNVTYFTPKVGDNTVRILPPTWDDARHFGIDVHVHYEIGPDKAAYLCLDKMEGKPCPICEERAKAEASGDTDYAAKLKASKRVLVYVIDRDTEKDGVKLWNMSWTIDRDLAALCVDKRTGEVYYIDHPDTGYDISFERKGTGLKTEYLGMQVARRASELGSSKWLDYAEDNPIPDLLVFHDYEHISDVFSGRSSHKGKVEDAPEPRGDRSPKKVDPTYEDLLDMDIEALSDLAEELDIRISRRDEMEDIIEKIADELRLKPAPKKESRRSARDEEPEPRRTRTPAREEAEPRRSRTEREEKPSPRDRLSSLRGKYSKDEDDDDIPL
jgi:hypothetical protein